MNKEDRNQYVLPFPNWLARFVKNLHLTPQGLLQKPGKNDRLIWDGSFQPTWDSKCINMMIDKKNEPELVYGHAFDRYLVEVWNQRITYPNKELYAFDDDVKGAFRHSKYYPDIASAFSFIIDNILYVALGATFGSGTSPSNFEPLQEQEYI